MHLLIIVSIILVFSIVLKVIKHSETFVDLDKEILIPKILWTYWPDEKVPVLIQQCMKTWRDTNPEYRIEIVNVNRVRELCSVDMTKLNIKPEMYQTFACLFILAKHGGIWMDGTIIATQSISSIIMPENNVDMIGFYSPESPHVPEPWFLAVPSTSKFIKDWLLELLTRAQFKNTAEYIEHIKLVNAVQEESIDIDQTRTGTKMSTTQLCASVLLQRHPSKYNIQLLNAHVGPLKYLVKSDFKLPQAFENLCNEKENQTPLILLRQPEIAYLLKNEFECKTYNPFVKSVVHRATKT